MFVVLTAPTAFILFLVGAFNQTLFQQTPLELYGFGLADWVLATLVGSYGPAFTLNRKQP